MGAQKLLEWLLYWARSSTESLRQLQLVVAAVASEEERRPCSAGRDECRQIFV